MSLWRPRKKSLSDCTVAFLVNYLILGVFSLLCYLSIMSFHWSKLAVENKKRQKKQRKDNHCIVIDRLSKDLSYTQSYLT